MADPAWIIVSRIAAGLLLYTGLGWLLSRWVGHPEALMAIGAMIGLSLSMYMVYASLHREGKKQPGVGSAGSEGAVSASVPGGSR
jgi:ATP synthase protein I